MEVAAVGHRLVFTALIATTLSLSFADNAALSTMQRL
jgi:hypothetical protein